MKTVQQVINGTLKSLYVKSVMKKNGWTKEYMRVVLIDYTMIGSTISLFDYLEAM